MSELKHVYLMNTKSLVCALYSLSYTRHAEISEDSVLVLSLTQETRHLGRLGSLSYANFRNVKQLVLKFSYMLMSFISHGGSRTLLHVILRDPG